MVSFVPFLIEVCFLMNALFLQGCAITHNAQTCMQQADVVFLIDGSGSIGSSNFEKLKLFLINICSKLDIGKDNIHIGVQQFSINTRIEFQLDEYTDRVNVQNAISKIKYMSRTTHTGEAISYMSHVTFSSTKGARSDVPYLAVVITDGQSNNFTTTSSAASSARKANITLIAVGVGNGVDKKELQSIAGVKENVVLVPGYHNLRLLENKMMAMTCSRHLASTVITSTSSRPSVWNTHLPSKHTTTTATTGTRTSKQPKSLVVIRTMSSNALQLSRIKTTTHGVFRKNITTKSTRHHGRNQEKYSVLMPRPQWMTYVEIGFIAVIGLVSCGTLVCCIRKLIFICCSRHENNDKKNQNDWKRNHRKPVSRKHVF